MNLSLKEWHLTLNYLRTPWISHFILEVYESLPWSPLGFVMYYFCIWLLDPDLEVNTSQTVIIYVPPLRAHPFFVLIERTSVSESKAPCDALRCNPRHWHLHSTQCICAFGAFASGGERDGREKEVQSNTRTHKQHLSDLWFRNIKHCN